ncbi:hypothetical protein MJN76_31615, partial [Salmonella enterica subsp. enterica serovar Anatum]|nr:hypothetical protein [Salmonella enterica subsp. enterica serovar Anatum]
IFIELVARHTSNISDRPVHTFKWCDGWYRDTLPLPDAQFCVRSRINLPKRGVLPCCISK